MSEKKRKALVMITKNIDLGKAGEIISAIYCRGKKVFPETKEIKTEEISDITGLRKV